MWSCGLRDGGCCLIVTCLEEVDEDLSISTELIAVTVSFNPLRGKIPKHPTSDDIIPSFSLPSPLPSFLSLYYSLTTHPVLSPLSQPSNQIPYTSTRQRIFLSHTFRQISLHKQTNLQIADRLISLSFSLSLSSSLR